MPYLPAIQESIPGVYTSNAGPPAIVRRLAEHRFMPNPDALEREAARFSQMDSADQKAVRTVHKALEEGRVLVDLETILRQKNDYRSSYPALAIAHIGDDEVFCRVRGDGTVEFRRGFRGKVFYAFQDSNFGIGLRRNSWQQVVAVTPPLPPELSGLKKNEPNKLVCWEATWHAHSASPAPRPRDPALLEWVAGSLYAVTAIWELSPVEAAILGSKAK